jgi:flagellar basal-body rod protein FlgB
MAATIDTGLDFFRQVLALRAYRQEILSADVANASTPGYKAVDLDFAGALSAATDTSRRPSSGIAASPRRVWLVDDVRDMGHVDTGTAVANAQFVKYQADSEVTLDGNSVDLDQEKVKAAANAVQYEAAATFTTQTIRMLMIAINGSGSAQSSGS